MGHLTVRGHEAVEQWLWASDARARRVCGRGSRSCGWRDGPSRFCGVERKDAGPDGRTGDTSLRQWSVLSWIVPTDRLGQHLLSFVTLWHPRKRPIGKAPGTRGYSIHSGGPPPAQGLWLPLHWPLGSWEHLYLVSLTCSTLLGSSHLKHMLTGQTLRPSPSDSGSVGPGL